MHFGVNWVPWSRQGSLVAAWRKALEFHSSLGLIEQIWGVFRGCFSRRRSSFRAGNAEQRFLRVGGLCLGPVTPHFRLISLGETFWPLMSSITFLLGAFKRKILLVLIFLSWCFCRTNGTNVLRIRAELTSAARGPRGPARSQPRLCRLNFSKTCADLGIKYHLIH